MPGATGAVIHLANNPSFVGETSIAVPNGNAVSLNDIAPGTWYDYLSSVRVYLAAAWPLGRRPDQLTPTEWRRLTTRVLQARPGDTETTTEARHKAWRRILLVLTCRTAYKAAEEALRDTQIARPARRYVPAAASTLWPAHMLPRICAAVDHAFRDEPLLGPQARALVMLLTDAGMRRSEAGGTRLRDLARDGSWIVRMTSGFGRRKVPLATGISPLSLQAGETLLSLKQLLGDPHDGPDYFLAQRGHSVNLAYALALYDEVVSIAREVVGSQALQALTVWLAARAAFVAAQPKSANTSAALFIGRNGTRLTAQSVWQRLRSRSLQAGLATPVHPHMLRHSFASHVLQSSGDLRAVQELLGHANISTTQVYTRLDFQHLAKAYDAAHPRARLRGNNKR